jgi:penicillin amidase
VVEEVVITRHGPIVSGLTGEPVPLALRWAALEPSDLIGSALAASRAAGWEEFRQGLAGWAAPPHNFVYADVAGNIGFIQAGWVPVRAKGYGMAPVPGWSSEYEWQRYLTVDEWPQAQNPESGWIGVANNLVVDPNYPHFISADLENPCRAARLVHLITSQDKVTIGDFARFQLDTYSAQAERFAGHLARLQPTNQREHDALTYLREWDHRLEPDSVAASLYHVCRLRALHLVFDAYLGDLAAAYVGVGTTSLSAASPYHGRSFVRLLDMLDKPGDTYWMRDAQTGIPQLPSEVLHRALRQALKLLREQLGDDMAQWTWGRLNRIHFAHPIGSVKPFNLVFNRGPYPLGGDHDTLLRASGKPSFPLEPVAVVDALRFIADPSDWDRCRIMIPGGQSGHVASRHYADRIPLWREGLLLSMPYSRAAVMRQARERLVLAGSG